MGKIVKNINTHVVILLLCFVSVSDIGVGSEGEGVLSGLLHSEEGQQAEDSGDQPGAEERGVCQTREPTQEGQSE